MTRGFKPRPEPAATVDRFATLNAFVDHDMAALVRATGSGNVVAVWAVLFRHADRRDGRVKGASIGHLALRTGLARNTVRRAVRALLDCGALVKVDPPKGQRKGGRSSTCSST
ncbi:MAG: helix-turn-helix domain-containing protein [Gemmataceae bacterium]